MRASRVAKPTVGKPPASLMTTATSVITISVSTSASWLETTEKERMWLTRCGGRLPNLSCDSFGILIADGLLDLANCNACLGTKDGSLHGKLVGQLTNHGIYDLLRGFVDTTRGCCVKFRELHLLGISTRRVLVVVELLLKDILLGGRDRQHPIL